jgi:outer membrane autotransporter protein
MRLGVWIDGYGLFGDVDGNRNTSDTSWTTGGVLGGLDARIGRNSLLGLGGGYANIDVGVSDFGFGGKADVYQGMLYGGHVRERFYVGALGRYAYSDFSTKRRISFGTGASRIDRTAKASFGGHEVGAYAESGYVVAAPAEFQLEPMGSLHYTWLKRDSFSESGASSIDLDVDDETWNSLLGTIGMRVHKTFIIESDRRSLFVPEIWARYAHQFLDRGRPLNASLSGAVTAGSYRVKGATIGAEGAILGAGWSVTSERNFSAFLYYDANINADFVGHAIAGGILLRF